MKNKALVVNMYGGPSTGKSTTAAGVFYFLKLAGVNCELVTEYAKDMVWGDLKAVLKNQTYVFGKQHNRLSRVVDKVQVAVTDSPLLNSLMYYEGTNEHFRQSIIEEYKRMNNLDIYLNRVKPFNPAGRLQDEEEARELDIRIKEILISVGLGGTYHEYDADAEAAPRIASKILRDLAMPR